MWKTWACLTPRETLPLFTAPSEQHEAKLSFSPCSACSVCGFPCKSFLWWMLQELGKAYVVRSDGEIGTGRREQKKRQAIDGTSTGRLNQIREFDCMKAIITVITIGKRKLNSEVLIKERGVCSSHYRKERDKRSTSEFGVKTQSKSIPNWYKPSEVEASLCFWEMTDCSLLLYFPCAS